MTEKGKEEEKRKESCALAREDGGQKSSAGKTSEPRPTPPPPPPPARQKHQHDAGSDLNHVVAGNKAQSGSRNCKLNAKHVAEGASSSRQDSSSREAEAVVAKTATTTGKSKQMTDINPSSSPKKGKTGEHAGGSKKSSKVTKFGRLLSKGLSKSPLKVGRSAPQSNCLPDGGHQQQPSPSPSRKGQRSHSKSSTSDLDQSPGIKSESVATAATVGNCSPAFIKKVGGDNNSVDRLLKLTDKDKSTSSSSSSHGSLHRKDSRTATKNAAGAPSSNSPASSVTRQISQKKAETACFIPSPYSFPSAPMSARKTRAADTSSNDSGHDSVPGCNVNASSAISLPLPTTATVSAVRMRGGRGAATAKVQQRAEHCQSSGYESCFGVEIEAEAKRRDGEEGDRRGEELVELTLGQCLNSMAPMRLANYSGDQVGRMDSRWRCDQVKLLRRQQEALKVELSSAKDRIGAGAKDKE
jgi:hypothetical protein